MMQMRWLSSSEGTDLSGWPKPWLSSTTLAAITSRARASPLMPSALQISSTALAIALVASGSWLCKNVLADVILAV